MEVLQLIPPEIKFLTGTEIFFMSGIMFLLGTYGGRFLNKLFPSYDSNKKNYDYNLLR